MGILTCTRCGGSGHTIHSGFAENCAFCRSSGLVWVSMDVRDAEELLTLLEVEPAFECYKEREFYKKKKTFVSLLSGIQWDTTEKPLVISIPVNCTTITFDVTIFGKQIV